MALLYRYKRKLTWDLVRICNGFGVLVRPKYQSPIGLYIFNNSSRAGTLT